MGQEGSLLPIRRIPAAAAMVHKLVETTDVFVENCRPERSISRGPGYKHLPDPNPRLVDCSVSADGHTGPDTAAAASAMRRSKSTP